MAEEEKTAENEDVIVSTSDLDVVRLGLGPRLSLSSASKGAVTRLGEAGRAALQKELPALVDANVIVRRALVSTTLVYPKKVKEGRLRAALAYVLENDPAVQGAMVKVEAIAEAGPDALDDAVDDNVAIRDADAPDMGLLVFMAKARQKKLDLGHPGFFLTTPAEALHLAWWADREAETDMVAYQQTGPFKTTWGKAAAIELVANADEATWKAALSHATQIDPLAALAVLKHQVWPEGWRPQKSDMMSVLMVKDMAIKQEAAGIITRILAGEQATSSIDAEEGPARRVPAKMGF